MKGSKIKQIVVPGLLQKGDILINKHYYIHFKDSRNVDLLQQYTPRIVVPWTGNTFQNYENVPCNVGRLGLYGGEEHQQWKLVLHT